MRWGIGKLALMVSMTSAVSACERATAVFVEPTLSEEIERGAFIFFGAAGEITGSTGLLAPEPSGAFRADPDEPAESIAFAGYAAGRINAPDGIDLAAERIAIAQSEDRPLPDPDVYLTGAVAEGIGTLVSSTPPKLTAPWVDTGPSCPPIKTNSFEIPTEPGGQATGTSLSSSQALLIVASESSSRFYALDKDGLSILDDTIPSFRQTVGARNVTSAVVGQNGELYAASLLRAGTTETIELWHGGLDEGFSVLSSTTGGHVAWMSTSPDGGLLWLLDRTGRLFRYDTMMGTWSVSELPGDVRRLGGAEMDSSGTIYAGVVLHETEQSAVLQIENGAVVETWEFDTPLLFRSLVIGPNGPLILLYTGFEMDVLEIADGELRSATGMGPTPSISAYALSPLDDGFAVSGVTGFFTRYWLSQYCETESAVAGSPTIELMFRVEGGLLLAPGAVLTGRPAHFSFVEL